MHNVDSDISKLVFWGLYRRVHLSSFFAQPGISVVDPFPISALQNKKGEHYKRRRKLRQLPLNPIHLTDTSAADLPVSFHVTKKAYPAICHLIHIRTVDAFFFFLQEAAFALSNISPKQIKGKEENHLLLVIGVHPVIRLFSAHPPFKDLISVEYVRMRFCI